MEFVPKAEFSIVTRTSSKVWIPELIAAAGPELTETYIDFFTATIRNRTLDRHTLGLVGNVLIGAKLTSVRPFL